VSQNARYNSENCVVLSMRIFVGRNTELFARKEVGLLINHKKKWERQ